MPDHVNTYSREDKEKWLRQRGWTQVQRPSAPVAPEPGKPVEEAKPQILWRDPDRGVSYHFEMAMKKALDDCRLPGDFELKPE